MATTKPDRPEPEDFKPSERDVDIESTVTKLVGDDATAPGAKSSRPPAAPARVRRQPATAPEKQKTSDGASGSWLRRLFKSWFG